MNRLLMLLLMLTLDMLADQVLSRDERIVALTILGEARGEGARGMEAVGCVIQKRMDEGQMVTITVGIARYKAWSPMTASQVCLKPWQFSVWNAGQGKVKKEQELYHLWKSPAMKEAREIARKVCRHGMNQEITGGANHYCALEKKPYWAFDKKAKKWIKPTKIIGNHKFYKL